MSFELWILGILVLPVLPGQKAAPDNFVIWAAYTRYFLSLFEFTLLLSQRKTQKYKSLIRSFAADHDNKPQFLRWLLRCLRFSALWGKNMTLIITFVMVIFLLSGSLIRKRVAGTILWKLGLMMAIEYIVRLLICLIWQVCMLANGGAGENWIRRHKKGGRTAAAVRQLYNLHDQSNQSTNFYITELPSQSTNFLLTNRIPD